MKKKTITSDVMRYGRKLFGAETIAKWLSDLHKHVAAGCVFTGHEANLKKMGVPLKDRPELILQKTLYDCFARISGGKKATPNWTTLKTFTYHEAKLRLLPPAKAKVTYMGKTTHPFVEGAIGVECIVRARGRNYAKPTLVFVSHPFHQYRVIDIMKG